MLFKWINLKIFFYNNLKCISKTLIRLVQIGVHLSMMSHANRDRFTHTYGLNFVSVGIIIIFLLVPSVLICNKDHSLNNVGFAIRLNHNDGTSVNIISKDESITLSRNVTKTNDANSNLHSNASKITNNGKLVILTLGTR